jgi:hypothetical protein
MRKILGVQRATHCLQGLWCIIVYAKGFVETQSNPVIRVLERHDALELLSDPSIKLFPQVLDLCDFEHSGLKYTGTFAPEDKEIVIKYDTYTHNKQDILFCTATAPLERWYNWQNRLPKDFLKALAAIFTIFSDNHT